MRKTVLPIALMLLFALQSHAQAPSGYTLTWSDEFNTGTLDTTMWKYRIGVSSASYQRSENVSQDSGKIRIALKKETYMGKDFTGGGIITKTPRRYGYYEVRVKIDGGFGWHEAFWTSWLCGFDDPNAGASQTMPRIEIDCFEHYPDYAGNYYTYGTIQWYPIQGNANRDYRTVSENLTTSYNTFGFEYTPDYLNYFYNGNLVKTIDTRKLPTHDIYLWLSGIATKPNATDSGTTFFDYLRCYEISPANYNTRKTAFIAYLDSLKLPIQSSGKDLWIEAEDFKDPKNWTKELDENATVLKGFTSKVVGRDSSELTATTTIRIDSAGTYKLWVRARDFTTGPGTRKFKVFVNGQLVAGEFGTHGINGYAWQNGGLFYLPAGNVTIKIFDSSQNFARCDKLLLTTDTTFIPVGSGGNSNVLHVEPLLDYPPFTAGNIVVTRIGNGAAALVAGNAQPVFLDEYTTAGVLVRSIPMPVAAIGLNKKFTLSMSTTDHTEGYLSRSPDGRFLALAGYDATPGLASVNTSASATVNRVVGIINAAGTINTTTGLNTFSGVVVRSAVTSNGTDIWTTGGNNGIRYATIGSLSSVALATQTARCLQIFDNQLYGSTTATNFRIAKIGTGLPQTAGQTLTNLPGIATASGSPYGIYMADLSSAVAGVDVMYVAEEGTNALSKYSLVAGTWVLNGKIGSITDTYRGLTGEQSGSHVVLYATRKNSGATAGGGEIVSVLDTTGYNASFASMPVVLLATAATNTLIRGIALAPDTSYIGAGSLMSNEVAVLAPEEKASRSLEVLPLNDPQTLQVVINAKEKMQGFLQIVNIGSGKIVYLQALVAEKGRSNFTVKIKDRTAGVYIASYQTGTDKLDCKFFKR
ncbi:family 16 glycosylhydrolase [Chitinophaga sp. SYP-B3965]|uniref:glycoside hydrolase family 16 protein n=1 Tax=Chitinophaga sp. SYP-B3965 TaxID=2663120 RepID=UPI0012998CB3|nr:glycoside hydrolase family 16 protein [Chitinophaga sp. SYP-B3965]MRG48913.1 family 16 glycosylhydrolase [Chitinophaga sp. SYP-B3965]